MRSLRRVEPLLIVASAIVCTCLGASNGRSQDSVSFEPYSVFVAEEEAFARCGPADDYYRTDPLRYGQALEVYAETEDGWLGIRPPEDSFCWIPADAVELDESQDEGTIVEDRTVAWIGTHLGRARTYRWQVQLAKGEPVVVIGRSEREGPDGPQLWYRIVPPSGEYRWVHRDSVVSSSEELVQAVRNRTQEATSKDLARQSETRTDEPTEPEESISPRREPADSSSSSIASSGASILNRDEAIGSGLSEEYRSQQRERRNELARANSTDEPQSAVDAFKQGGLLASIEFLTRPRIQEIGGEPQTMPNPSAEVASLDSTWVAGATRTPAVSANTAAAELGPPNASSQDWASRAGDIMQVSAQAPTTQASSIGPASPIVHASPITPSVSGQTAFGQIATGPGQHFHVVSAERIQQIEAEVSQADLERLNLILSQLMAAQASAAETEPVERAARRFATTAGDPISAGRARMLAETADRYRRVATRRDGNAVIQGSGVLPMASMPSSQVANAGYIATTSGTSAAAMESVPRTIPTSLQTSPPTAVDHAGGVIQQTGYLVQVYSARSNSPPFALTDHAGRTVAYVTPVPGVNLRTHLNSHISVVGTRGYLTGLNTPHVMVTQAVRTPE